MSVSVDQWQEYHKRRNPALFVFLGYVPVVLVIAMVTMRLFHTTTEIADNDRRAEEQFHDYETAVMLPFGKLCNIPAVPSRDLVSATSRPR